jgi:cyanamide hydratase
MCQDEVAINGWTSTPADAGAIFGDQPFINKPEPLSLDDVKFPFEDPIVAKTLTYARGILHPETFNHSMRVYFYGMLAGEISPKECSCLGV